MPCIGHRRASTFGRCRSAYSEGQGRQFSVPYPAGFPYSVLESDIRSKLEESNYLVRESGNLRFALNISFVFPNIDFSQVESELSETEKVFCGKHVLFKNDIHLLRKEGKNVLLGRLSPADEIKEEIVNNIFQRLCPEITIPRKFILDDHATISVKEAELSQMDRAVQSYRLDNWQIDIVNRINKSALC